MGEKIANYYTNKILLVEDNYKDVELIKIALSEYNIEHEIKVVNDGAEALDYLYCKGKYQNNTLKQPSLIILDLKMPKLNGFELLAQLKASDNCKQIPVVVFTSSNQDTDIERAYHLGANAFVIKSVDFTEFSNAIRNIISFWIYTNKTTKFD